MIRYTLQEAVTLLSRPVPEWDGGAIVMRPPLLLQLRAALRPGMEGGAGGSGGSSSRPSIALNALDLLSKIETEIHHEYWLVKDSTRRPGGYTFIDRLQYWAASVQGDQLKAKQCEKILRRWIAEIEELFNPQHRIELQGACPECEATHYVVEEDGEHIRKTALTATPAGKQTFAECGRCGARWSGPDLHHLSEHVTRVG